MRVIAVVGAKGGTTKSTSCLALGHLFAAAGHTVAMVDGDPQGSITRTCGLVRVPDPLEVDPVTIRLPGTAERLHLARGGRSLEAADEAQMDSHLDRSASLEAEVMLIDTPPALGPIARCAIRRADLVLVPCSIGTESLDGFADVRAVANSLKPGLKIRGFFVLTRSWHRLYKWSKETFESTYPGVLYPGLVVPHEVDAAAAAVSLPVTAAAPNGRAAEAYHELAKLVAKDVRLARPAALTPVRV